MKKAKMKIAKTVKGLKKAKSFDVKDLKIKGKLEIPFTKAKFPIKLVKKHIDFVKPYKHIVELTVYIKRIKGKKHFPLFNSNNITSSGFDLYTEKYNPKEFVFMYDVVSAENFIRETITI